MSAGHSDAYYKRGQEVSDVNDVDWALVTLTCHLMDISSFVYISVSFLPNDTYILLGSKDSGG